MRSKEEIRKKGEDEANFYLKTAFSETMSMGAKGDCRADFLNGFLSACEWLQSAESETAEKIKRMSDQLDAAIKEDGGECAGAMCFHCSGTGTVHYEGENYECPVCHGEGK